MIYWLQEATEAAAQGATSSLPSALISPVLAALFGAVLGSTATHLWQVRRDRKQHLRELVGLLRLIDREVAFNQTSRLPKLAGIQDLDLYQRQVGTPLVKEAWQQARVRLAQLLENSGDYSDLADYYHDLQELNDRIGEHGSPNARG